MALGADAPGHARDEPREPENHERVQRMKDTDGRLVLTDQCEDDLQSACDRQAELKPDPWPSDSSKEREDECDQDPVDGEPAETRVEVPPVLEALVREGVAFVLQ